MFAVAVAEASELSDVLRVAHKALRNGVHGVLEGERTLELTCLHLERVVLLPFCEGINHTWCHGEVRGVAVHLQLCLPVEVLCHASFECHTHHTDVERVDVLFAFVAFLVAVLILRHDVAAELDVAEHFQLRFFLLC